MIERTAYGVRHIRDDSAYRAADEMVNPHNLSWDNDNDHPEGGLQARAHSALGADRGGVLTSVLARRLGVTVTRVHAVLRYMHKRGLAEPNGEGFDEEAQRFYQKWRGK